MGTWREGAWTPVIAERGRGAPAEGRAFPCRGELNRYTGCVGVRRCRASGVERCILGNWPGEATLGQAEASPVVPVAEVRRPAVRPVPVIAAAARPTGGQVGVLHGQRRVWQGLSRPVGGAGLEPVWFATAAAACEALSANDGLTALLADPALLAGAAGVEAALLAAERGVPVLRLPPGLKTPPAIETAARMAIVWLTIARNEVPQRAVVNGD